MSPNADISWLPSAEYKQSLALSALMAHAGVDSFDALHRWSVENPEAFWEETIARLGIVFDTPPARLLDVSRGAAQATWLSGSQLNIAQSCFSGDMSRPAIITRRYDGMNETLSFAALDALSNRVAHSLKAAGLKPGDAVAIDMLMTAEAVAMYLGVIKAGMVVVSIPDSFPEGEISKRLRIGQVKLSFTQDVIPRGDKSLPMASKVRAAAADLPHAMAMVVVPASGPLHYALTADDQSWQDFLLTDDSPAAHISPADAMINIIFSSGTTGDPKAIPWLHYTPIKCGSDALWHHNISRDDVVCWPTSLGWMMGPWLIFASFLNGAPIALYEGSPTTRDFCEFVAKAKVTMLGLVPSIAKAWRASGCAEGIDFSSLRCYSSSGEASNADDYAWLMQLGQAPGKTIPIVEYCGGTEIAGGYLANNLWQENRPAQFNGKALGIDFMLMDEAGNLQPTTPKSGAKTGELFIIPPALGLSDRILNRDNHAEYYEGCPNLGGAPLRRHGDRIIQQQDGYFCSDGRSDNAMNLGGIKTGSAEIERALSTIDAIVETAAIGVAPSGGGPDQLVVFAVMKAAAGDVDVGALKAEMNHAIRSELNPLFKVQDVVVLDELPRTASNKVMHRELKTRYKSAT